MNMTLDEQIAAAMVAAEAEDLTCTRAEVSELPDCYYCGRPAVYDAVVVADQWQRWAFMCQSDMDRRGPNQLGRGIGQRLVLVANPTT